jgi:hypothetical protein
LKRSGLACVLAAAILSCEAVPVLHFESEDAGSDVRSPVDASRGDGGPDSGSQEDGDGPAMDAAEEVETATGCPGSPPAGGVCCDKTPCIGDCGDAGCASCIAKCGGELCCAKNVSNPMCRSLSAGCP